MFYGLFGMGKIFFVKVIVIEYFFNFFSVKGFEFFNMYIGELEVNVCCVFQCVCDVWFCVVFFDELDFVVLKRGN